jgi:hypothetical protein
MYEFHYERYHIPSGELSRGTIRCLDRLAFLAILNDWNRTGFTLWQYAAIDIGRALRVKP